MTKSGPSCPILKKWPLTARCIRTSAE
jgi:hypothetical protein